MKLHTSIMLLVALNSNVGRADESCLPLTGEYRCIDDFGDPTNDLTLSFPSANTLRLNTDVINFAQWTPLPDEADLKDRFASAQCVQGWLITDHKATDINAKTGQPTGTIEWRSEWTKSGNNLIVRSTGKVTPIKGTPSPFDGEFYCRDKNAFQQSESECPDLSGDYRCGPNIQNNGPSVSIRRETETNGTYTYFIDNYALNSDGRTAVTPKDGTYRNGTLSGQCKQGRFVITLDADLFRGESIGGRMKVKMARRLDKNGDLVIVNKGDLLVGNVVIPINGRGICNRVRTR